MNIKKIGLFALFCFTLSMDLYAIGKKVIIYTYHLKPPFIVNLKHESGLYYDFSDYLNQKQNTYHFVTKYAPRKRAEHLLRDERLYGALIGVTPAWFGDKEEKKYLWTQRLLSDRDEMVSLKSNPLEYTGARSLYGKKLGGVLGYYYWAVDKDVKAGNIMQVDVKGEESILRILLKHRVDIGIVSRSTYNYLLKHNPVFRGKFHISRQAHETFERRILVPLEYKDLYVKLNQITKRIENDPEWQKYLDRYR